MTNKTIEIITSRQAEERWGKCPHEFKNCSCTYIQRPEVKYYVLPLEIITEAVENNKTIIVVEDMS